MDEPNQGVEEVKPELAAQPEQAEQPNVEAPATEEAAPSPATETDELPQDELKRREAFIKMRQENKALKSALYQAPSEFEALEQQFQQPLTPDVSAEQLLQRARLAEQASIQAIKQVETLKRAQEDSELYGSFPELNPNSEKFDQNLDARVAEKYYFLKHVKGEPVTPLQVAQMVRSEFETVTAPVKEAAKQETLEKVSRREFATQEVTGNSAAAKSNAGPTAEYIEGLKERVRRGDRNALIEMDKIIFG